MAKQIGKCIHYIGTQCIRVISCYRFVDCAESRYGCKTKIIVADFTAGEEIYTHIKQELNGLEIGTLGTSTVEAQNPVLQIIKVIKQVKIYALCKILKLLLTTISNPKQLFNNHEFVDALLLK